MNKKAKKIMNVSYVGQASPESVNDDLLLRMIGNVSGCEIRICDDSADADLIIVHPYVVGRFFYKMKWLLDFIWSRFFSKNTHKENRLRWILGVGDAKVLVVSHENLDRPYWWNMFGRHLLDSDIPRLTYWPHEVDPVGERFPYWYNYVDWPQYPRKNFYKRFGRLYKLEELMSPLPHSVGRLDKVISISSHMDHPRQSLLTSLEKYKKVDSYGLAGTKFEGSKIGLMGKYKYAFCPENSTGYGYDTEKLPEAWIAGCIPVGISLNPFTDFNYQLFSDGVYSENLFYEQPLLLKRPRLDRLEGYLSGLFA